MPKSTTPFLRPSLGRAARAPDLLNPGADAAARGLSTAVVLWLLAVWLFATIGLRPLLVPDEGRYATIARDMLLGGDWLVPRLDGLPFFHKPPLMYWIDAAAMAVFGVHPFAARVAPALGAWLLGAALYLAMKRWHGRAVALRGLAMLATMPLFFLGGQYANHDMLVASLITAAVLAFAEASEGRLADVPRRRLWQLGWVACGLALLSKGLIGLVLPLAVAGPWVLLQRRGRAVREALHPASWLPAVVIAAPWFVAMQWRYPGFCDYFIVEQHFRRFAGTVFNNVQPAWFFVAVLPLATLPWSLAAPWALWRERIARDRWTLLYAWWALVIVGFFSMPQSKLVGYVLPALAPWCALLARGLRWPPRWQRAGLVAGAAICLGTVAALTLHTPHSTRDAGRWLAPRVAEGDRVIFVDEMYYDLAFELRSVGQAVVLSDWSPAAVAQRDNWRKELADAARFDPQAAGRRLWPMERASALLCAPGQRVWFVSDADAPAVPGLAEATTVFLDATVRVQEAQGRDCAPADLVAVARRGR